MQKIERCEREKKNELKKREQKLFFNFLKNNKKCPYCNTKQNKIALEKPTTFVDGERKLTPIDLKIRLEKITNEDE